MIQPKRTGMIQSGYMGHDPFISRAHASEQTAKSFLFEADRLESAHLMATHAMDASIFINPGFVILILKLNGSCRADIRTRSARRAVFLKNLRDQNQLILDISMNKRRDPFFYQTRSNSRWFEIFYQNILDLLPENFNSFQICRSESSLCGMSYCGDLHGVHAYYPHCDSI